MSNGLHADDRDRAAAASDVAPPEPTTPPALPVPASGGHDYITLPDTLISLIVAFVIAMMFRGFVVEGFMIPTGSMAPTLLGEHSLWRSPLTGYTYAADSGDRFLADHGWPSPMSVPDPMFGPDHSFAEVPRSEISARSRPGDRVLVFKWLFTFIDPKRFDVLVFRNPTNARENYIKRLGGLPNEEIWLADGDVFTRPTGDSAAPFRVQRKPDHVQRAVWQPVFDSAWMPDDTQPTGDLRTPWVGAGWQTQHRRTFRTERAQPTILNWDNLIRPIDDWNAYNIFARQNAHFNVSDVRIGANIVPDDSGLRTTLRLLARAHEFEFEVTSDRAVVRMRPAGTDVWDLHRTAPIDALRAGRPTKVEFWHVDQRMAIYIDRRKAVELKYDWTPRERLEYATGVPVDQAIAVARAANPWSEFRPLEPRIEWRFAGSAVSLHDVHVDRDLYYRPTSHTDGMNYGDPGYGTHPERTAITGPDQFFMLGDNSAHSTDSRLWGEPANLVAHQIDPAPYLVHRRLIIGKAWSVYFPAPHELQEGGARFIPDFGRVRFIR